MVEEAWQDQGAAVVSACRRLLPGLVGVYVHGSAALGGMTNSSDLDVLVITETGEGVAGLGRALLADVGSPRPLELSVVARSAAIQPQWPWPYLLHVNSAEHRANTDSGDGDPDLIAHYAVTRAAGIALTGPEPAEVIGPVDRGQLLDHLGDELRWGLDHSDQRYAVLNACRASAYAATGRLLSKLDGAAWWVANRGASQLVERAREAQAAGVDLGPAGSAATAFVNDRITELRE
ncbi:aminoglycoside adenylyltransferase domain-containing protein [Flexivirga alba]|uniref:Aminoglycoside adenylyltransferase domain-containing protein n=1 Tax=Flexivirga alba TaxID=702742 RepID=A0ABW2ACE6_9MICO